MVLLVDFFYQMFFVNYLKQKNLETKEQIIIKKSNKKKG